MNELLDRLIFLIINGPKYFLNWVLLKIFNFEPWHVSTFASRPYCIDLVDYVNDSININDTVVEIGCGLGESLARIKCRNRYGFDTSQQVLKAARIKFCFKGIKFFNGSFDDVLDMNIDYLIAVNFLHDFETEQVKMWFDNILNKNNIQNIIVDELTDENYFCLHKWELILPKEYKQISYINNQIDNGRVIKLFSAIRDHE